METKICKKCNNGVSLDNFFKDSKSKDGLQSYCKICKSSGVSEYYKNNPDKRSKPTKEERRLIYYKKRLNQNISRRMRQSLKSNKNGNKWETLVTYTLEDLKKHLEKQFSEGMNWENYGEWHIDHIRPISSYVIENYEDKSFKDCWSLNNLRPLWAKENLSKGGKII